MTRPSPISSSQIQHLAMASTTKSLTVFGGNGFLGKRICQRAVLNGYNVVSLSRSGNPPKPIIPGDNEWISKVNWQPANIFQPDTFKHHLAHASVVVHSIGILLEKVNYKNAINNTSLLDAFLGFASSNRTAAADTSAAAAGELNTYEKTNHQSATLLAQTYLQNTEVADPKFVYVSADSGFWPVVPSGYINSKRAAEYDLLNLSRNLDRSIANDKVQSFSNVILRPGFMFDEQDLHSVRQYVQQLLETAQFVPGAAKVLRPSVSTQKVAKALFQKLVDPETRTKDSILSLEAIRRA